MLLLLMTMAQPTSATSTDSVELPNFSTSLPKCPTATEENPGEIIVCARRTDKYRIDPSISTTSPSLRRAEFRLSDEVGANIGARQENVGGYPSNRVMFSIKVGF